MAVTAVARLIGLARAWREQVRSNRQQRELSRLGDHLLRDIGLDRDALCWRRHAGASLGSAAENGRSHSDTTALGAPNLVALDGYRARRWPAPKGAAPGRNTRIGLRRRLAER
jgi:uncharacterized protein YjiS (DUF1127 family)